jgi:hypothetical protein
MDSKQASSAGENSLNRGFSIARSIAFCAQRDRNLDSSGLGWIGSLTAAELCVEYGRDQRIAIRRARSAITELTERRRLQSYAGPQIGILVLPKANR